MFKLAHFSDPHLSPLPKVYLHHLLSKRITGFINHRRNRGRLLTDNVLDLLLEDLKTQKPDHIALTGDLVNLGLDEEIRLARIWLETISSPENLSLVPGNHDAYVPFALRQAKKEWAPYFLGDDTPEKPHFPYYRQRGPLAIIGLSTALATLPFMATGTLGKRQIAEATKLLSKAAENNYFRLILIHHPPFIERRRYHKRLTDYRAFRKMIKKTGAEMILHGHTHRRNITMIDGPDKEIPVIGVPSASSGLSSKHQSARYNLFEIEKEEKNWSVIMTERGLTPAKNIDILDTHTLKIAH